MAPFIFLLIVESNIYIFLNYFILLPYFKELKFEIYDFKIIRNEPLSVNWQILEAEVVRLGGGRFKNLNLYFLQ